MGVTCPSGHSSSSISYFVRRSSEEIPKGRFKLPWESITTVNQYQRGNPAVLHVSRVMHVPDTVIKIIRYRRPRDEFQIPYVVRVSPKLRWGRWGGGGTHNEYCGV